ncbi:MAG: hypothetical protein JSW03_03600 [Candidatus Eiseniibacteriota bacterium]|nr:MAG: hypothetical protein JSW03_03600 [Candidatus Eisenbacteria bacterium]
MSLEASERGLLRLFLAVYLVSVAGLWLCLVQGIAPGVCIVASLLLLLIAPGFVPALGLRRSLRLSALEVLPLAVSLSLAQATVILLLFDRLSLSVLHAGWPLMLLTLGWWAWTTRWARLGFSLRRDTDRAGLDVSGHARVLLTALLFACLVVVSVLMLGVGAPMQWETDSVAHVAAVRGVLEEGRVFPVAQPYGPNGVERADVRFGVFHALCAVIAATSGAEVHTLWNVLPAFFAPLLILAIFSVARAITGSTKAAFAAALIFPLCYGGERNELLRIASYPNRVSMLVYLVSLGMFFRYLRDEKRWLLWLLAALVATTAAVHVYYFIEFLFVTTCFLFVKLLTSPGLRAEILAKWTRGIVVASAVSLPLLLYRFLTSYSTANPYAVEEQGILFLGNSLYILNPLKAYGWLGLAGAVSILLLPYFILRAGRQDSHAFITAATAGPLLLIFNPVLLPLASKVLNYLAWRLMWAVPYALSLGIFLAEFRTNFRLQSARVRVVSMACLLLIAWALVGVTTSRVAFYRHALARRDATFTENMAVISNELSRLDRELKGRRVLLSDPVTAYAIPAFTRHFVTAIPVAHSAPGDSFPVSRVRDALDVLNPSVSIARTREVLRQYRVEFVVVNTGFLEKLYAFEYQIDPLFQIQALEKISSTPVFEHFFSEGELHVFSVVGPHQVPLAQSQSPLPGSEPLPPEGASRLPDSETPSALVHLEPEPEQAAVGSFAESFSLESVRIDPVVVSPGDSVRISSLWKCLRPLPREDVFRLFVRFETDFPRGTFFHERFGKIYRKLLEGRLGTRFRFRVDLDPHSFDRPLHLWQSGEFVRQEITVAVPEDVSGGTYVVEMSLRRISPATNFRLSDFLQDRDYYSGVEVGRVEVRDASVGRARPAGCLRALATIEQGKSGRI